MVNSDPSTPVSPLAQLGSLALLYLGIGVSVALCARLSVDIDLPAMVRGNSLNVGLRRQVAMFAVGGGLLACLPPALYLFARPTAAAVAAVLRIGRILSPLLLSFMLPFFFTWQVFKDNELLCVVSASLFGLGLERTFRMSFGALPWSRVEAWSQERALAYPRLWPLLPTLAAGALTLFFCVYFSYFTVLNHYRLNTRSWDLAIFDNINWNLLRGKWFKASPVLGRTGSHIQYHATFDAYLFLPFYALRQRADTLLVLQATVAGLGAIPLYLLARRRLASAWGAVVLVYAYVIHAPLHGPIFYDFHYLTTAPFWTGWTLYLFETRRRGWLVVAFICALLLREDISAGLAMVSLFYMLSGERTRVAFAGGLLSALYFLLVKFVVMPLHMTGSKESFTWIFQGLIPSGDTGFGAVLRTIVTNPIFTLESLLTKEKFQYIMKMFAPVLFLPFRGQRVWVMFIGACILTILSTGYAPTVQTFFQYASNWTAYIFLATAIVIGSFRPLIDGHVRAAAALAAVGITATALSYNHGAIFQHNSFRGGFTSIQFQRNEADRRNLQDFYELVAMVPPRASIAATETEAPHVSNREDCFTLRFDYGDAEYLLVNVDEARGGNSHTNMERALATGAYGFVASRGHYALWSKRAPHDKDAEGGRLIGVTVSSPAHAAPGHAAPAGSAAAPGSAPAASGSAAVLPPSRPAPEELPVRPVRPAPTVGAP